MKSLEVNNDLRIDREARCSETHGVSFPKPTGLVKTHHFMFTRNLDHELTFSVTFGYF